ncbi:MAG: CotH kinase family protein [Breznakibacter sp.]
MMFARDRNCGKTIRLAVLCGMVLPVGITAWSGCVERNGPDAFFTDSKVHRIDIVIDTTSWGQVVGQLKNRFGSMPNAPGGFMPGNMPRRVPAQGDGFNEMPGFMPPPGGMPPMPPLGAEGDLQNPGRPMPGGFGNGNDEWEYVPCEVRFNGKVWGDAGFRVKGNSSLMHTWMEKKQNYPFRLKFAKFQKESKKSSPNLFYGMEKLSFSNGLKDRTRIREKLTADMFAMAGVPVARTVLCEVYFVIGTESRFAGIYTAVEIVEDTMLEHCFGNKKGNCYKPDGRGATFANGTFAESSFEKKNNKKSDYNDVERLYRVVNDSLRFSNPSAWEQELESVFDVGGFLKWMAVNSVIQNWDTYGRMAHNYYLYGNPGTHKMTWIPWDNNEAFSYAGMGGGGNLDQSNVGPQWPLISYLWERPRYQQIYRDEVGQFGKSVFTVAKMEKLIDKYHGMLKSVDAIKNDTSAIYELQQGFDELKTFVDQRRQDIGGFLGTQDLSMRVVPR